MSPSPPLPSLAVALLAAVVAMAVASILAWFDRWSGEEPVATERMR